MAKRRKRIDPSEQKPEWRAERAEEVELVRAAAAEDPAAQAAIIKIVFNGMGRMARHLFRQGRMRYDADVEGELIDLMLDWLEDQHDEQNGGRRTGWEKLADFRGESELTTFMGAQVRFLVMEYRRRVATRPGLIDEIDAIDSGKDAEAELAEGIDGEPEEEPPPVEVWDGETCRRVMAASGDPTHRLAYYLTDLLKRFPPAEEVVRAAAALGVEREELARRVVDLRLALMKREARQNETLAKKQQTLERKRIRLQQLRAKRKRGNTLRDNEELALDRLPEQIRELQEGYDQLAAKCEQEPVVPTNQEIATVLFPAQGKGKDRATVFGWVRTIRVKLEQGGDDGRGGDDGLAPPSGGGGPRGGKTPPRPSGQRKAGPARPSNRRSS